MFRAQSVNSLHMVFIALHFTNYKTHIFSEIAVLQKWAKHAQLLSASSPTLNRAPCHDHLVFFLVLLLSKHKPINDVYARICLPFLNHPSCVLLLMLHARHWTKQEEGWKVCGSLIETSTDIPVTSEIKINSEKIHFDSGDILEENWLSGRYFLPSPIEINCPLWNSIDAPQQRYNMWT